MHGAHRCFFSRMALAPGEVVVQRSLPSEKCKLASFGNGQAQKTGLFQLPDVAVGGATRPEVGIRRGGRVAACVGVGARVGLPVDHVESPPVIADGDRARVPPGGNEPPTLLLPSHRRCARTAHAFCPSFSNATELVPPWVTKSVSSSGESARLFGLAPCSGVESVPGGATAAICSITRADPVSITEMESLFALAT